MQFKKLLADERAVSPVIGVILMVAITVILAAVIGTFVLGLGNNLQETSPNTNFQFDYEDDGAGGYNVIATHQGGATINEDNADSLVLTAAGNEAVFPAFTGDGVSSGDSSNALSSVSPDTTVRVIWTAPDGSNSQTLAEGSTPS